MKFNKSKLTDSFNLYQGVKVEVDEDEISNGNTEDSLLSSRNSSETISSSATPTKCCPERPKKKCGGVPYGLIFGVGLITWGITTFVYTPYEICLDQRLNMMPGLPPYEWWRSPPDEVLLRVYIFNITNSEEFLSGNHTKLRVEEIGPIVYSEILTHTNVTFNDNGTMTYVATRKAVYLPEMNTIDLNATIIVPNIALLIIPSYLYDASFFTKLGVNLLIRRSNSPVLINTTIYNFLWNSSDPVLQVAKKIAPAIVPTSNVGILSNIYDSFVGKVTVYIGSENSHEKFFLIDKYDGSEFVPRFDKECTASVQNSTEGVCYPQKLTENVTLKYWRKSICKVMELYYEKNLTMYGVEAKKFILGNDTYDRTSPTYKDCYQGVPRLPSGLADISPCYYGVPFAVSFPHFLYADKNLSNFVEGMKPDVGKHQSYVIVEPTTGVPLQGNARSQNNLVVRKLTGFNERVQRFSDVTLPLCWIEYNLIGIPWYVTSLVYFQVKILPHGQSFFSGLLVIFGTYLIYNHIRKKRVRKGHLVQNVAQTFESQTFLKNVN